jgi:putative intracellular protease/amidase
METILAAKILLVVTSHAQLGNTGKPTGYYLPEVSHPAIYLTERGAQVDIASPRGGKAPMDEGSRNLNDPINRKFLANTKLMQKLENTLELSKVDASLYDAIIFAGGHGTMWDFADDVGVQKIAAKIYENGGVVAAVCHGPAALTKIKLSTGAYLVAGKNVTGFSNAEEDAVELTKIMPFLLEDALKSAGGIYKAAANWEAHTVVDGRLVTGQNPASAEGVARAVLRVLEAR